MESGPAGATFSVPCSYCAVPDVELRDCGCEQSGSATFCMHHCQDAFDALEAIKRVYPDPIAAVGFPESLLAAVAAIIHDFEATVKRMGIPSDEAAQTIFVDGLMMGVLLAARAPTNHAAHVLSELST